MIYYIIKKQWTGSDMLSEEEKTAMYTEEGVCRGLKYRRTVKISDKYRNTVI